MTDADAQGPPPRSWWVDALNPIENLRALADAQQFGRRAAEDLADRFLGEDQEPDPTNPPQSDFDTLLRRVRADSVRAADVWLDLMEAAASMFGLIAARGMGADSTDARSIEIGPVAPGAAARATFWVHNSSGTAIDDVQPHCSPLRSHQGEELAADAISFDPARLDPLPARSSCGVEVNVTIPPTVAPATYATLVLVSNVPALYLPMRVTVVAGPDPG